MSWLLRPRHTAGAPATGANARIDPGGAFGLPQSIALPIQFVGGTSMTPMYSWHEGDLFLPGAGHWVFEPNFELPLVTVWGKAFIRYPNTFNPIQPPQLYMTPNVFTSGIGGLQAGQLEMQPLIVPDNTELPFSG